MQSSGYPPAIARLPNAQAADDGRALSSNCANRSEMFRSYMRASPDANDSPPPHNAASPAGQRLRPVRSPRCVKPHRRVPKSLPDPRLRVATHQRLLREAHMRPRATGRPGWAIKYAPYPQTQSNPCCGCSRVRRIMRRNGRRTRHRDLSSNPPAKRRQWPNQFSAHIRRSGQRQKLPPTKRCHRSR